MGTPTGRSSGTQDALAPPSTAVVDVPEKVEPQYASSDDAKSSDASEKNVEKEQEGSMKDFFVRVAKLRRHCNTN